MYVSKYHQGTKVFDHWNHQQIHGSCCPGAASNLPATRSPNLRSDLGVSWPRKKQGLWKPTKDLNEFKDNGFNLSEMDV